MLEISRGFSLLGHNTFGIDVQAAAWVEYSSAEELREVARMLRDAELPSPWMHVGGGSNLLFTKDWPGTLLHSRITGIEELERDEDAVTVRAGAGTVWDELVKLCVDRNWYGTENLTAVPGETGAAAVQNIGAYGAEISNLVRSLTVMDMVDGSVKVIDRKECGYGYRYSIFKRPENRRYVVMYVDLCLGLRPCLNLSYKGLAQVLEKRPAGNAELRDVREAVLKIRAAKLPDPAETGSAGSFFTNPVIPRSKLQELQQRWPDIPYYEIGRTDKDRNSSCTDAVKLSAGWLIEQCGWKGRSVGRAGVYSRQALVIVNLGGATGTEIASLAAAVRTSVRQRFGIDLHPEVNIL